MRLRMWKKSVDEGGRVGRWKGADRWRWRRCPGRAARGPTPPSVSSAYISRFPRTYLPRRVHEQLPIGSSFCSPTPALSITLTAHSAVPVVQCMPTTSRATFSSGHGKSSTKSATSSLTTKSSRPPFSLKQNQSRCARHNWVPF
jgi:hypothetical protein